MRCTCAQNCLLDKSTDTILPQKPYISWLTLPASLYDYRPPPKKKNLTYLRAQGLLDNGIQATLLQAACVADAGRGQDGDGGHAEHEQDEHQHLPNTCAGESERDVWSSLGLRT